MNSRTLRLENLAFAGTHGVSENNRDLGFKPAFLDKRTGRVELARHSDGREAGMHLINWLPRSWAETLDKQGRVLSLKPGIIAGFVQDGVFYTREEAAEL